MANKKIRASILGKDINLLKNVAKRVVKDRPADVKYFTEVKEFLMDAVNDRPDVVAISVNYPHKSAAKFPKIFSMVLNLPVIMFGEDQEVRTRKELSSSNADFKIAGVITAHNFWMKLVNFQKLQEKEIEERLKEQKALENSNKEITTVIDSSEPIAELQPAKPESGWKKQDFEKLLDQDENSLIDSLFAQMGGLDEETEDSKKNNLNIIKSKDSVTKATSSHLHWDEVETQSSKPEEEKQEQQNFTMIKGEDSIPTIVSSQSDLNEMSSNKELEQIQTPEESGSENGGFESDKSFFSEDANPPTVADMLAGLEDEPNITDFEPSELPEETPKAGAQPMEELVKKPKVDEKGRVQLTDKNELKKREFEKQKERQKKDDEKTQNVLKESCDEALKKVFLSKSMEKPRGFETSRVYVYTIEVDKFKGFLLLNNSFNQDFEDYILENLRSAIIESLKSKGYSGDLSLAYNIAIPESKYVNAVEESCEFTLYDEEETGKQIFLSFLKREVISPQYHDSDKEGMITVDMKTIPPQTPVNFDAFIYMPINKKFVRYLKEGRSLSLKQVKRHIEGDEPCMLYLPKSDKGKLIQFFIQNTISWEFISYNAQTKESA